MKKLGNLLRKDVVLGIKDIFLILELVFAVVFMILLTFIIPEDIQSEGHVYILDESGIVESFVKENVPQHEEIGEYYVSTRNDLIEGMTEDRNAIGLIIESAGSENYRVELLTQPYTKAGVVNFIDVDLEDLLNILHPPVGRYPLDVYESVRLEALDRVEFQSVPFNRQILPMVIIFNVGLIGLFAMVSLVGQERMDDTLRAYRLAPTGMGLFLLSKYIVITVVSLVNFTIIYLPVMGFDGYVGSFLIMLTTIISMSSLGVLLAGFYKGPMEAIGWVFVLMLLFALPTVSLLNPVFSPAWLQLIPTFHSLFGMSEAMFTGIGSALLWRSIAILGILSLILAPLTAIGFGSRIRKEA